LDTVASSPQRGVGLGRVQAQHGVGRCRIQPSTWGWAQTRPGLTCGWAQSRPGSTCVGRGRIQVQHRVEHSHPLP
jgi:hypothetical protein